MKNILTITILCLCAVLTNAQVPGGGFSRGGQRGQQPTGRFYGRVVDNANKGIEAASVTLVQTRMDTATKKPKETIVGGMLTDKSGDFSIENVPAFGRYKLRVTGIGYNKYEQNVQFPMPNRSAAGNGDPSALLGALDKDLG